VSPIGNAIRICFCAGLLTVINIPSPAQDGCQEFGHSACGGSDRDKCPPNQRFISERCSGGAVRNRCSIDEYCARTTKGRVNIDGKWITGVAPYQINQSADSIYITGGAAGPANGAFISANQISVTWPQAKATFIGTVSFNPQGNIGTRIDWDHPAGNFWHR